MARFVIKEWQELNREQKGQHLYLDDWQDVLLDTKTNEIVYADGGEPEDMILCRDLGAFVTLLNEVAEGK